MRQNDVDSSGFLPSLYELDFKYVDWKNLSELKTDFL